MSFYDQYELLELSRDDGVKTFRARDKATNQPVTIHLFSNPAAPYQAELLRKIAKLPDADSGRITARGSHLGAVYLVTDSLAPHAGLLEWITAATKRARRPEPPPTRMDESPAENEKPQKVELPLSAVTEPAGQIRLNQEFADLFRTTERPVFPDPPVAATPTHTADPNEVTQAIKLPGPNRQTADPNEATQAMRIPPVVRAQAGTFPARQTAPVPPSGKPRLPLVLIMAAVAIIGILAALFLLFFARRAHYL